MKEDQCTCGFTSHLGIQTTKETTLQVWGQSHLPEDCKWVRVCSSKGARQESSSTATIRHLNTTRSRGAAGNSGVKKTALLEHGNRKYLQCLFGELGNFNDTVYLTHAYVGSFKDRQIISSSHIVLVKTQYLRCPLYSSGNCSRFKHKTLWWPHFLSHCTKNRFEQI